MWIFCLRNKTLPHITTIFSRHYIQSLPFPPCGEFSLLPDSDIPGFGSKNKILPGTIKLTDSSRILIIVISTVQFVQCQRFIAWVMCRPANCQVSFICYCCIRVTFIIHHRAKNGICYGIINSRSTFYFYFFYP